MVEEEKSPLSVSVVTFGFDLIVPLFFLTVYEVSARMHVQHAKHAQISEFDRNLLKGWVSREHNFLRDLCCRVSVSLHIDHHKARINGSSVQSIK